ncbi:hypothetical protein ABKN59_010788 [Abortiporus biennis]
MAPQSNDEFRPSRPRANTSAFAFNWRRGRQEPLSSPPDPIAPLAFDALVEALTPPAVPSLNHARALAAAVPTQNPKPRLAQLIPILHTLCGLDSPPSLQAAGFDILTAFWETADLASSSTPDKVFCFSLLQESSSIWSADVWEPRFRALVAFTQSGSETVGIESSLLKALESWIVSAFSGLLSNNIPYEEKSERQRSVETMASFLVVLVGRTEFVARLRDDDVKGVLLLYGGLIDQALSTTSELRAITFRHLVPFRHQRNASSSSLPTVQKNPVDFAVEIYLNYLSVRLKAIAPDHLSTILPHLFRALSYFSSPLPRLSLSHTKPLPDTLEKRLVDTLDSLLTGPCSSACMIQLKFHLLPTLHSTLPTIRNCMGALRTLRTSIRRFLKVRMVRAYIQRSSSMTYTPSGAPGQLDLEDGLMEKAWAKDDVAIWGLNRFCSVLCRSVTSWLATPCDGLQNSEYIIADGILNEIAAILTDFVHAFDEIMAEGDDLDYEEADAFGRILRDLVRYIKGQTNPDGTPVMLDLTHSLSSSPILTTLSFILSQDIRTTSLYTILPSIVLSLALHITDTDTTRLITSMTERQLLSPTSPLWLEHWNGVLEIPDLFSNKRACTRQISMEALQSCWEFVKDIPVYRRPLADVVFSIWKNKVPELKGIPSSLTIWRIVGEEVAVRSLECLEEDLEIAYCDQIADDILDFLIDVAQRSDEDEADTPLPNRCDTTFPASPASYTHPQNSALASPNLSRLPTDIQLPNKEQESAIPSVSVMSILSSITSSSPSHPRMPPAPSTHTPSVQVPAQAMVDPNLASSAVGAVVALVTSFTQLAFSAYALAGHQLNVTTRIFQALVSLLSPSSSSKTKITVLQFLMRLRVDRDHRIYYSSAAYDMDGHVLSLCSQVSRTERANTGRGGDDSSLAEENDIRRAYSSRVPPERNGRKTSRGAERSKSAASRSRSRAPPRVHPPRPTRMANPLWTHPETTPFNILAEADTPSTTLISFDPAGPGQRVVLPLSSYLAKLVEIIRTENDWEVLSYVLCHLPTQMANKHLFCGPKSRHVISDLLDGLTMGILDGSLATTILYWPEGLIARDAHGLAYHTLTVLISYRSSFKDIHQLHRLVEVLLLGLNGQPSTIKCCLHALSLCAFELQPSMTKYLPRILEKLSQIMSNPSMAVHIIDFLAIVGSLDTLHTNFTEEDFKMVFGVALQYLQHHNRADGTVSISWALSQHVRVMSYYIVYLWFLAVKLPDRPRHIKFITRQLLLANEGKDEIDEPAEVCFDWLARYTYASADPRPAESALSAIIFNPSHAQSSSEPALSEKTWIAGHSIVTIRTLARRGWAENVPLVTPGDVNPDIASLASGFVLDRSSIESGEENANGHDTWNNDDSMDIGEREGDSKPDPITGYVWSGSAPSQRRKEVAIDPSYFALQLSAYPDPRQALLDRVLVDSSKLPSFFRSLDLMPVIDTHKVGIMYVAPGQTNESDILGNTHGSPAYSRFLEGLGRLINLRGQVDVYAGGLDPDEDGEYAYAWWDDIGQVLFHTATLMPPGEDKHYTYKKRHIGNDYVRIIWNDSGLNYKFDTLSTQFQFVNIVIEPHSRGAIAAYSNNVHENEYFKITVQRAPGMTEFTPIGDFKLISAIGLPLLVRQLCLLSDWFVSVYQYTVQDTRHHEMPTNWRSRLQAIKRFRSQNMTPHQSSMENTSSVLGQESFRDFTTSY